MAFDPKTDRFPYPEVTDRHYLKVKKDRGIAFDADYPYIDRSDSFLFRQKLIRILLNLIVFPMCRVRLGLRIENRRNLKAYKTVLENGVVSVSNHVHMWDYIAVMRAIRPFRSYFLCWAPNVNGESGTLVRLVGGTPIPENNVGASKAYLKAIQDLLEQDHGWLHIYAEGSMWEFYAPIRPFKRGAAHIACDAGKPILPLAFSYRKAGWIRTHVFHQIACLTLRIGEPLYPNAELRPKERERELTKRCHEAVCRLAGIDPKENVYPPFFNDSKRIDYYTDSYGVG